MGNRRALSLEECMALQAELEALYRLHASDHAVAAWLGCSQQSVHRARTSGRVGPVIANGVYELLGITREMLLAKNRELGAQPPAAPPASKGSAASTIEDLKLPEDPFRERFVAARRALAAKHWGITPSAIEYVCTAPEWQSPRFSTRSAVFWVEQMKVQTAEEGRAVPASEEDRIFQEALRALHAQRAKMKRKGKAADAARTTGARSATVTRIRKAAG
jgi:hypothetical protein